MKVGANGDFQSLNTARLIGRHTNNAMSSVAKLASNSRINSGADDPAGVVVAAKLKGRAMGSDAAAQNAQNAAAWAKAADTAYGQVLDILYREREIATEAADYTASLAGGANSKAGLDAELGALEARITDIVSHSKFGDQSLFQTLNLKLGTDGTQVLNATLTSPAASGYSAVTLGDASGINTVETKIASVAKAQAEAGGYANALGYIADGLASESANMWDAHANYTTTNTAKEMTNYVKNTVASQSAELILSQYNQNAYSVLNLLR